MSKLTIQSFSRCSFQQSSCTQKILNDRCVGLNLGSSNLKLVSAIINIATDSAVFRFFCACSVLVLNCVHALMFLFSCRTGKDGYIQIDGGAAQHGQSKGRSLMVNTKGSIYLGEWTESMERQN